MQVASFHDPLYNIKIFIDMEIGRKDPKLNKSPV